MEKNHGTIADLRPAKDCVYDLISLGEVNLRLDPGENRIRCARDFHIWECGGEYNVARALRKGFGMRTAIMTALADNDIGRLVEDCIMQGGTDSTHIIWRESDGIGLKSRNSLIFTERGYGIRGALSVSDRGHTAASQIFPGEIDWDYIFGKLGSRWFHTGGVFAALSPTTGQALLEAVRAAKKHRVVVSYDLNYRASLWNAGGGLEKAREINREVAKYVDVMIGNEEDFTNCLGYAVEGTDEKFLRLDISGYKRMVEQTVHEYPNFKVIATTLRTVKTATINDWQAICWANGKIYESKAYNNLEVFDRVGGGDGFASGLIYGLMTTGEPQKAVEYGAAHGAFVQTTPGDTSMANVKEVEKIIAGGGARVVR
jgi:2-dehydro-3-deoxygluconokinase